MILLYKLKSLSELQNRFHLILILRLKITHFQTKQILNPKYIGVKWDHQNNLSLDYTYRSIYYDAAVYDSGTTFLEQWQMNTLYTQINSHSVYPDASYANVSCKLLTVSRCRGSTDTCTV